MHIFFVIINTNNVQQKVGLLANVKIKFCCLINYYYTEHTKVYWLENFAAISNLFNGTQLGLIICIYTVIHLLQYVKVYNLKQRRNNY